jgi:hypothetical protein
MGTKMGPKFANNLFVGSVEKQIFKQYTDHIPDYLSFPRRRSNSSNPH